MQEAWIELQCSECDREWEANPADLPGPDDSFTCDGCGTTRPMPEFTKTARGLEILEGFHAS